MKRWAAAATLTLFLAGCGRSSSSTGSAGTTSATARTSTASADNPGDPNTPCAVVFTLGHGVLSLTVTSQRSGELVIEPAVNGAGSKAHIMRRDILHLRAGTAVVEFHHVKSVDQIPSVLYTSPSAPHSCSVVRKGDSKP